MFTGNSGEPHVHLQLCDGPRLRTAHGLPFRLADVRDDNGRPLGTLHANGHVLMSSPTERSR